MKTSLAAAMFLFCSIPALAQVPPPPLSVDQANTADLLRRALLERDAEGYSRLLADDLEVFVNNNLVFKSKEAWLKKFSPSLKNIGNRIKYSESFQSNGRIMIIEDFDSSASFHSSQLHSCCRGKSAVLYDVSNGKIRRISRLDGGFSPN